LINEKIRINTIDGFRLIAIFSVILFHFYSHWTGAMGTPSYYPYGDKYSFFSYGYLGVQFFFIISGFVIAFTLHRTRNIVVFWEKRLARLLPAMLLCSAITFFVARKIDTGYIFQEAHSFKNFLFSLTFASPKLLNRIVPPNLSGISYLNFSYWSLWPEIQFYVLASVVYYIKPGKFARNFCILALIFYSFFLVIQNVAMNNMFNISTTGHFINACFDTVQLFNIFTYVLWFSIGVIMFDIYSGEANLYNFVTLIIMASLLLYGCADDWLVRLSFLAMMGLFLVFLYYPRALSFLSYKPISKIGMASYSLYLIHEVIGNILIMRYASYFGKLDFLFPLVLIAVMIGFSLLSFRFIERPIIKFLARKDIDTH
jgi:peptidoglycan/LPS O-acetylase OafA/YrhL